MPPFITKALEWFQKKSTGLADTIQEDKPLDGEEQVNIRFLNRQEPKDGERD